MEMQIENLGIPSEIRVIMPEIKDIKILHDVPEVIRIQEFSIPDVKFVAPEIPTIIKIQADNLNLPSVIALQAADLPSTIRIDASGIPNTIKLEMPEIMPVIKIDASEIPDKIKVVGIPSTIELVGAPSAIQLVMPEKPEIELVYKGAPIDVKINLDMTKITGEDGKAQCVAIVPCNPN
jgi:hypothetical protein